MSYSDDESFSSGDDLSNQTRNLSIETESENDDYQPVYRAQEIAKPTPAYVLKSRKGRGAGKGDRSSKQNINRSPSLRTPIRAPSPLTRQGTSPMRSPRQMQFIPSPIRRQGSYPSPIASPEFNRYSIATPESGRFPIKSSPIVRSPTPARRSPSGRSPNRVSPSPIPMSTLPFKSYPRSPFKKDVKSIKISDSPGRLTNLLRQQEQTGFPRKRTSPMMSRQIIEDQQRRERFQRALNMPTPIRSPRSPFVGADVLPMYTPSPEKRTQKRPYKRGARINAHNRKRIGNEDLIHRAQLLEENELQLERKLADLENSGLENEEVVQLAEPLEDELDEIRNELELIDSTLIDRDLNPRPYRPQHRVTKLNVNLISNDLLNERLKEIENQLALLDDQLLYQEEKINHPNVTDEEQDEWEAFDQYMVQQQDAFNDEEDLISQIIKERERKTRGSASSEEESESDESISDTEEEKAPEKKSKVEREKELQSIFKNQGERRFEKLKQLEKNWTKQFDIDENEFEALELAIEQSNLEKRRKKLQDKSQGITTNQFDEPLFGSSSNINLLQPRRAKSPSDTSHISQGSSATQFGAYIKRRHFRRY